MNWIFYILAAVVLILSVAQIFLDYILKHVFKDARKIEHKKTRLILLCVAIAAFIGNQIVGYVNNHKKEQEAKQTIATLGLQITNLSSQVSVESFDSRQAIQSLSSVLATNQQTLPPAKQLAILDVEEGKVVEKQNELTQKRELISVEVVDLKTLRAERENKHAQLELQDKLTAIQRERAEIESRQAEIQNKEAQEQAQLAQQKESQKIQKEILQREKLLNDQCLSVFDYVIRTLYTMLRDVSKDTKEEVKCDFLTTQPSIYESNLIAEGKIIRGTNSIRLGTNSAWNFEISTTRQFPVLNTNTLRNTSLQQRRRFSRLIIVCQGKNGISSLTIWPNISATAFRGSSSNIPDTGIDQVSVSLNVPDESKMSEQYSFTNYTKAVDAVLRTFIEAEDNQFPLTIRGNK